MSAPPKKPRLDEPERRFEEEEDLEAGNSLQEQEETLVALIDHRKKEVDNLRNRVAYYSKQLAQAEDVLSKENCKLVRLRKKIKAVEEGVPLPPSSVEKGARKVMEGSKLDPVGETDDEPSYLYTRPPKPKLIIPTGTLNFSKPSKNANSSPLLAEGGVVVKEENTSSDNGVLRVLQDIVGAKRKYEPKEQPKGVLIANEKNSCPRCLSDIGAIGVQHHGGNGRRYELEEHHKGAIFVKEENGSGSSSDSEVSVSRAIGTKSKYGTQAKYIQQCRDALVANVKNTSGRSSDIGAVGVQHVGAERKYEPKEHRKGDVVVKEENSSGSSSDCKVMKVHDIVTKRKYERKEQHKGSVVLTQEKSCGRSSDNGAIRGQDRTLKMRYEAKQHKDIIPLLCSTSSACTIGVESCNLFSGQHRRKLRTLSLCPADDMLFATSALDGVVNLWKMQGEGVGASLLSSTECSSVANNRRWPEDVAWHPQGKSLFCAYTADEGSSQVSIIGLNKGKNDGNSFLEHKPHKKGIINSIIFMPWEEECFVTGGSDHSVIMWEGEGDDIRSWEPTALHRNMHSSAVMGVAGMVQRKVVLSVGADKKIFGYDVSQSKVTYKHQMDSKCMSILPNPHDINLFMVQTGKHESQLRLFDIRDGGQKEVYTFGWRQQCSESQSALVRQVWSPDGLYISSGSSDPVIHIFDVRYNGNKPSQSICAHQKRVFKAVWHQNLPLMVSISSDANIALHKINK